MAKITYEFEFEITPVPKQSFRMGKFNYQPERITNNKAMLRLLLDEQIRQKGIKQDILDNYVNPVELFVLFEYPFPKATPKKKLDEPAINGLIHKPKTTKPDCDNLIKQVKDSFQGVLFQNDSQVYSLEVMKGFNNIKMPKITVDITYLTN